MIHTRLAAAAARLRRAEISARWLVARSLAMRLAAVTAAVVAVVVVFERLFGGGVGIVSVVVMTGTVAAMVVGIRVMRVAPRPDWRNVAERLDMAANDHNAIATALDLAQSSEPTVFEAHAIAAGITAAAKCASTAPVIDLPPAAGWRDRVFVLMGFAAVALAGLTPLPQRDRSLDQVGPSAFGQPLAMTQGRSPATPAPSNPQSPAARPDTPAQGLGAVSAADSTAGRPGRPAAMSNSSSSAGTSAAGSETDNPAVRSSESAPPSAARGSRSALASPAARTLHAASFGSTSSDAAESRSVPDEGSGGESSAAFSAQSDGQLNDSGGMGGPPSKDPSGQAAEKPGGGGSAAGANGPPTKSGQSGMKLAESNEAAGGSGKGNGGGQGSPKKSRGVAPLMLGTREPDLIGGPQLPGPDERTKLQVRPRSGPESPAADSAAAQQGIESPVNIFRIPPGSRGDVKEYLQMLHQQQDQPAAGSE